MLIITIFVLCILISENPSMFFHSIVSIIGLELQQ